MESKYDNLQKRIERASDIGKSIYYQSLGFGMPIDEFLDKYTNEKERTVSIVRLATEIAKGGYGITNDYSINEEYVLKYFLIICLMLLYSKINDDNHTFKGLMYICEMYDDDAVMFGEILNAIEDEEFQYYVSYFMEYVKVVISPLTNSIVFLILAYLDKKIEGGYLEDIGAIMTSEIEEYIKNNTYDAILSQIMQE